MGILKFRKRDKHEGFFYREKQSVSMSHVNKYIEMCLRNYRDIAYHNSMRVEPLRNVVTIIIEIVFGSRKYKLKFLITVENGLVNKGRMIINNKKREMTESNFWEFMFLTDNDLLEEIDYDS